MKSAYVNKRLWGRMLGLSCLVLAGLITLPGPAVGAASLRVIVNPPRGVVRAKDLKDQHIRVDQCLSLYLYDWFSQAEGVALVDEGQAGSVLGMLNSPAWIPRGGELYASVNASVAIDALVTWKWTDGKLGLELHRKSGVKRLEAEWLDVRALPKALKAVTEFLSTELAIQTTAAPTSRGLALNAPQLVEDYYVTQRAAAEWVDNSGEMQLDVLRPYLNRLPRDIWAAAAIVRSGMAMSTDSRAVTKPGSYMMMIQQALPCLLGTAHEPVALEFMRINHRMPEVMEKELLGMVSKIGQDEVEAIIDDTAPRADALGEGAGLAASGAGGAFEIFSAPKTVDQQAGAIRCLAAMSSKAALPHLDRISKSKETKLRQAVASGLGFYGAPTGAVTLAVLVADPDPRTALLAAHGLWRQGQKPKDLLRLAGTCLEQDPGCKEAIEVLAREGAPDGVPRLKVSLSSAPAQQRVWVVQGLIRLNALTGESLVMALSDPDAGVTRAALAGLGADAVAGQRERLMALANHADLSLAEAARQRLQGLRPADPEGRRRFELAVEHSYVRRQILASLAKDGSVGAIDALAEACGNTDPQTRAYALKLLSEKHPEKARVEAIRLLQDSHRWVRLQAASTAARLATPGDASAVKAAVASEKDAATRLYLDDALARAEGRPLPAPRPAANILRPDKTAMFLCGHAEDCVDSPAQGYYELSYNPDEPARKAHAAGKIFFARSNNTAKNPVQVLLNMGWRDGFWLGMEEEFGDLAALDGVVLGEESMYFRVWNEWDNGWRLFCREAGIDPGRVAGDKEKLTGPEKQAWWQWEQRVAIEGFNEMYDYIKLRYGKLRPGFQVCTFMPDQNGPCDFDREWKFDVGAGYYYETNNRHRYTQIRRFKTVWPGRPVLWLCDGSQTSLHTPMNYKYPVLQQPVLSPHSPAYADTLCAWMAGANPGYFIANLALAKDMKPGPSASGVWMFLENLYPKSPVLEKALDHMFRGVEGMYRTQVEMKAASDEMASGDLKISPDQTVDIPDLDEKDPDKDPYRLKARDEMERLRLTLLLERKLAWDCARLLADLPFPVQTNAVLLVGDLKAQAGALRLPSSYDVLDRLNAVEGQNLAPYRVIAVANGEAASLRNATVTNLTTWLKTTPGLLYVRGWLNTNSGAELSVIGDLDGRLEEEWPWAKDITYETAPSNVHAVALRPRSGQTGAATGNKEGKQYRLTGGNAVSVGGEESPALVFWRGAGFKGGVVFDASDLAPGKLRDTLNQICIEKGIGTVFQVPIGIEIATPSGIQSMASCAVAATNYTLQGVDLLTGILDPKVGPGRTGAFVGSGFTGTYAASWNGVSVLGDRPLGSVKAVEGGMELECKGLLQAVSVGGDVDVRCEGKALPLVATNPVLAWVLLSSDPGIARVAQEASRSTLTFIRTSEKVRITKKGLGDRMVPK